MGRLTSTTEARLFLACSSVAQLGMCLSPTRPSALTTTASQILLDAQGGLKVVIPEEPPENSGLLAVFVDNSNM